MNKKPLNIILAVLVLTGVLFLAFCVLNGRVMVGQTSAESANLTSDQLAQLKHMAIDLADRKAAARIYWYYRFTKKDYAETKKWKYAVENYPGEDDGLPK